MADIEVRICENCGHANEMASLECEQCGYDLSFVIPTIQSVLGNTQSQAVGTAWTLKAADNSSAVIAINGTAEIGREGSVIPEYLNKSNFISRCHAKLYIEDDALYVEDASTNGTFVNGNRIPKLNKTALNNGDEIVFADLKFIVGR
ncbi:MAG TPA: FHA domain-containing protein [Oscillospiraceae bacterium]|nr:FHA domain-containing protein [Oscillospiraceae bacterium]